MLNLIDVSSHQKGLNVSNVSGDGVIVKATEGVSYVNPLLTSQVAQTLNSGKVLGLYHYAKGKNGASQEAKHFLNYAVKYIGEVPFFLDFEEPSMFSASGVAWAKQWLDYVDKSTGIKPMIYMNLNFENNLNWDSVVLGNYGLWIAQYNKSKHVSGFTIRNLSGNLRHWPASAMFQYTNVGRLNGWGANLDLDVFYGDRKAWNAYGCPQGTHKDSNEWHRINGVFVIGHGQSINLRTAPAVTSYIIATLRSGAKISYDAWSITGGYLWIRQHRKNGGYGYLATGKHDGRKRESLWGSGI
ncbi:GH25 family lysozyme [Lacticaseibacillus hulanensis]|uniref:GH25 family lysozyme n=1 Tax=Lacticaseibacillus hulanensis TaxID=2493111 RepID=UPI000FDA707A|nr:GH25 family lysozyme [Lacticaseibacillus hulanensis]